MRRRQFAGLSLATLAASPAGAQGDKVVRIVVGFPAGQGIDLVSRILAEALQAELGETMIIDNKPGQGGGIALAQVARAAPDGTTISVAAMAALVIAPHLYKTVGYDTLKSFVPVGRVGDLPLVLVVNPEVPAKTLTELIAYARANPDKLSHSSSGNGTVSHVAMEGLKRAAGIRLLHVPYQGSAKAMNDLIAGTVQVALDSLAVTRPHIEAGRLRLIAVGSLERLPGFPDAPTIAEQGFPGFEANAWVGMLLPAHAAPDQVQKLAASLGKVLRSPEVRQRFAAVGTLPRPSTAAEFGTFLAAEYRHWGEVIAQSGMKVD